MHHARTSAVVCRRESPAWRLLVVGDEVLYQSARQLMECEGWSVSGASTPCDSARAAAEAEPDVVLLDLGSASDSLDLLEEVLSLRVLHGVPVIALSDTATPHDTSRVLLAGAHDLIAKPFVHEELQARLIAAGRLSSSLRRRLTEWRKLERQRAAAEERFRLGFERSPIGMLTFDKSDTILSANQSLCNLLGYAQEDLLGAKTIETIHEGDRPASSAQMDALVKGDMESYRVERRLLRADGSTVWTLLSTAAVLDEDGDVDYFLSLVQDITDQTRSAHDLEHQALHDPLTGLPNRLAIERHLNSALERSRQFRSLMCVLLVDVDQFKLVNDRLGHAAGDAFLKAVAARVKAAARDGDLTARFGGDEFVVVCEDVAHRGEAEALARRMLAIADQPIEVGIDSIRLSLSCGIVVSDGKNSAGELLRDADVAMYTAKERGRGRAVTFDESLRHDIHNRFDVEYQLGTAIEEHQLRVFYQPIVGIPNGRMIGAEALVRWQHPERGLLAPADFIPAAEESGLIVPLGEYVLEEALRQIRAWRRTLDGCSKLWVSVNLSPRQLLTVDPVELCTRMLARTGTEPSDLHIEITESAVMSDVDSSAAQLNALRDLGVGVAVDDFGTGYSSLAYLSRLPVSLLKIDRSFVTRLNAANDDATIVRTILQLADGLGVSVCAEGVETFEHLDVLASMGCEMAQGYLWSKPLAPSDFERQLRSSPEIGVLSPPAAEYTS